MDTHGARHIVGPRKATNRVTAQNLSAMAKKLGRCGDINPLTGYVCVTQEHGDDVEHMAAQIGGPNDGKVYATWGGVQHNSVMPKTAQIGKHGYPIDTQGATNG